MRAETRKGPSVHGLVLSEEAARCLLSSFGPTAMTLKTHLASMSARWAGWLHG